MQSQKQNQCQSVRKLKQDIEKLDIPFKKVQQRKAYTFDTYEPIVKQKLELMIQLKDNYAPGRMTVQSKKFIENNRNSIDNFMDSYVLRYTSILEKNNQGVPENERVWHHQYYEEKYNTLNTLYTYVYSEEEKMCPCDA